MSRFTTNLKEFPEVAVKYGLDHALGWWYEEYEKGMEEPTVERDSFSGNLSKGEFIELLEKTNAPKEHLEAIVLDLDPAKWPNR
jgi:hypothetical protein